MLSAESLFYQQAEVAKNAPPPPCRRGGRRAGAGAQDACQAFDTATAAGAGDRRRMPKHARQCRTVAGDTEQVTGRSSPSASSWDGPHRRHGRHARAAAQKRRFKCWRMHAAGARAGHASVTQVSSE